MLNEISLYIIVIYVVITVKYCKRMLLLDSPLNSYLYVHWILDFKYILLLDRVPLLPQGHSYPLEIL